MAKALIDSRFNPTEDFRIIMQKDFSGEKLNCLISVNGLGKLEAS